MNKYNFDSAAVYDFYNGNYKKFGYSEKSLAWNKGKQNIRFSELTKNLELVDEMKIFDIGCGFGDLNKWLQIKGYKKYYYKGVDLVEGFIDTAKEIYKDNPNITFVCDDFLNMQIDEEYDYIIASGIFNFKMHTVDNYENIYNVLKKALSICKNGGAVALDFQSDKVDYIANDIVFYNSPERVLGIAYEFSRNVILDNSCMPFEFSLVVFKDDSFCKESTTFNKFEKKNSKLYERGVF